MRVRTVSVLTVIITLFFSGFGAFAQMPTESEQKILHELRAIRTILLEVKKDIAKLQKEVEKEEPDEEEDDMDFFSGHQSRKADTAKLRKIKLPQNPTEEQIEDYIEDIMNASRGQNSFSSEDRQVMMLTKIGAEHLELLINAMDSGDGHGFFGGSYHVKAAILKLAREEDKKLILDSLPQFTFLVQVVLDNGWEKDAKEVLLDELESAPQNLPSEWIQAVVNLNDSKTYDDLKWYLINRDNRYGTFQTIRDLPGIDLEETVAAAWDTAGNHEWEERGIAKIAIQYGHVDALKNLVDFLNNKEVNRWEVSAIRPLVIRHIDFYGSNTEISKWLTDNSDNLTFDKKTKKFSAVKKE